MSLVEKLLDTYGFCDLFIDPRCDRVIVPEALARREKKRVRVTKESGPDQTLCISLDGIGLILPWKGEHVVCYIPWTSVIEAQACGTGVLFGRLTDEYADEPAGFGAEAEVGAPPEEEDDEDEEDVDDDADGGAVFGKVVPMLEPGCDAKRSVFQSMLNRGPVHLVFDPRHDKVLMPLVVRRESSCAVTYRPENFDDSAAQVLTDGILLSLYADGRPARASKNCAIRSFVPWDSVYMLSTYEGDCVVTYPEDAPDELIVMDGRGKRKLAAELEDEAEVELEPKARPSFLQLVGTGAHRVRVALPPLLMFLGALWEMAV